MSNQDDRGAIEGLFDRIEDVSRNSAPRDHDAERVIQQRLQQFPPAPYYMAQTILIQEEALRQARARIEELEGQTSPQDQPGGFMGGPFGQRSPATQPARARGPWGNAPVDDQPRQRGGGFLAGAAQTALGVTGGMLLGSAIAGMFSGGANAEELSPEAEADQGGDQMDSGGDDFGGDDFDMGGEF